MRTLITTTFLLIGTLTSCVASYMYEVKSIKSFSKNVVIGNSSQDPLDREAIFYVVAPFDTTRPAYEEGYFLFDQPDTIIVKDTIIMAKRSDFFFMVIDNAEPQHYPQHFKTKSEKKYLKIARYWNVPDSISTLILEE